MENDMDDIPLECPRCGKEELSEEILYKMYETDVDDGKSLLEGVQVEITCKSCYFSWYLIPMNQSTTVH